MGRQVFAEPPDVPGVCRITREGFAPTLQEPDGGCEHDGGTDDHEEAGESFLSTCDPAHTAAYPLTLAPHHAVSAMLAP